MQRRISHVEALRPHNAMVRGRNLSSTISRLADTHIATSVAAPLDKNSWIAADPNPGNQGRGYRRLVPVKMTGATG